MGWSGTNAAVDGSGRGSSSLPPHTIINEFPEYGTAESSRQGPSAPSTCQAEPVTRSPERRDSPQRVRPTPQCAAPAGNLRPDAGAVQLHTPEKGLQPTGNLPEIMKISRQLEATKVQERANTSLDSETQMEKKSVIGSQNVPAAREPVPAGQEKLSDMLLPSEGTAEEKKYLIIKKDLASVRAGEKQSESSQAISNKAEEVHRAQEPSCHKPSVTNLEAVSRLERGTRFEEFSEYSQGKMQTGTERRLAKEAAVSKHVEFQGVEILWLQKAEEQRRKKHSLLDSVSVERKALSKTSSHPVSPMISPALLSLPDSAWSEICEDTRLEPAASGATPLPLLEEGRKDEVSVKERKNCDEEEMAMLARGQGRMVEEREATTGGYEDFLGQRHSDVSTDLYSSQFENILDNASLYYSAESLETLYSEPDSYFSFEMPLTPMIQQRMKEGGQFLDRTSAVGQTDVPDREVKGCGEGIANGFRDVGETLFKGDVTEVPHLERRVCCVVTDRRLTGREYYFVVAGGESRC
ncbi:hypothetical protein EK904_010240 [Melospiza melodia maxima]|nr:hypothetical protein EK904_010240 [Melospiza melodia maxima]